MKKKISPTHDMPPETGGTYYVNEAGTRVLTEEPTRDHPEGNRPRPADEEITTGGAD